MNTREEGKEKNFRKERLPVAQKKQREYPRFGYETGKVLYSEIKKVERNSGGIWSTWWRETKNREKRGKEKRKTQVGFNNEDSRQYDK